MSDPIRLGVVCSALAVGGAEQLLLDLLAHLDRDRFAIRLAFLQIDPGPIGREAVALGLPAVTGLKAGRFDPVCPWRLWRWFRRNGIEVALGINHLDVLLYGLPAAKAAGVPFINWENETGRPYAAHALTMVVRRLVLARVDTVVAAAEGHKTFIERVEAVPASRIALIYNGVDPSRSTSALTPTEARQRLDIAPDAPVVAQVAALRPDKAHEIMLRAFVRVRERLPGAVLLLAGDGPRREALSALADRLGLQGNCRFLGVRRDVGDILAAANVFALSSAPLQETLSVAAIEAMFAGLPVVATDVGSMDEIVLGGETGRLVPPGDPAALAEALTALLADPETARRMGQRATQLAKTRFGIETMVAAFADLFAGLARRGGQL